MKKWIWLVVIIVVIIVGIIINTNKDKSNIKIGFISALSGDVAIVGDLERTATEMAVTEINEKGGIDGRKLEVIYEDAKCNGKEALTVVNKLITVDGVKVILGAGCSSETLAIIPVIEKNKILTFSAASSHPDLTGISRYFFRNYPSDLSNGNSRRRIVSWKV